jgi:Fic-DOC domain mobile mystery protein B
MTNDYILGQTPLEEDEKRDLIPSIITRQDLDAFEQENILEARKWVMQRSVLSRVDIFTEKFLLDLHRRMYSQVWKWAGKYRKTNKNIGVDSYQISTELYKLLGDASFWIEHQTYLISDLAVVFHHRLVKIHLFPNGNGRHARLCADIIVAKFGAPMLTWGGNSSLIGFSDLRQNYINALREADSGNYHPLLVFARS